MKNENLTTKQREILEKYVDGNFSEYSSTEEEKKIIMEVIDKAEELMFELDGKDEPGDDLLIWFWEKIQE